MAENQKKVVLSQPTELEVRGKTYTVYPISIASFVELDKYISKLEKEKNIAELGKLATEIAYTILNESGNEITKEDVAKSITMEALQHIIQAAIGKTVSIAGK
jgi:hypothetical protein